MSGDIGLRADSGGASTFVSVILVAVVLILAVTFWTVVLGIGSNPSGGAPQGAFDTESGDDELVLKHAGGETISPDDTSYVSITGNENITVDWNDDVTNGTARPSDREAVVTEPITSGAEIAVVTGASLEESLSFVWFAVDGTGYTLLDDMKPPDGTGVDGGGNPGNSDS